MSDSTTTIIQKFYKTYRGINNKFKIEGIQLLKSLEDDTKLKFFIWNGMGIICVSTKVEAFESYTKLISNSVFINYVYKNDIDKITFFTIDLFVCKELRKKYQKREERESQKSDMVANYIARQEAYYEIVKEADRLFDLWKHRLFHELSKKINDKTSEKTKDVAFETFKKFSKIKFINEVVPYWILEELHTC